MPQPTGTVTLLFTDVEGSTKLLGALGDRYGPVLAEHRRLLREAFAAHGGVEVDTQGDAFFVAFPRPQDALAAAAQGQRALASHAWPDGVAVRVRMGIHTGTPTRTDEGYVGVDVHRAARVMAAGHGGQVVVSEDTARLADPQGGLTLADVGEHQLKDLTLPVRLYQLTADGLASEFPPLKTLGARPNNLPAQPAPLVGREQELAELRGLLAEARLLTLTGPGGTGKTRLALQLAADALDDFPSGVFFVPLAAVREPELVVATVAQTLSLRGQPGETAEQVLGEYLRERELLLVLDNLEQVADAGPAIASLLDAAGRLRVLATSREPLRIAYEREYAVDPLTEDEAVGLFTERSGVSEPREAVVEICRRLDFLPLAVELAAARTKLLPPPALLARLERRLPLLTGGRRDAPERQRTLRATIEWSHDLLHADERETFSRLAVFAGSFGLEAAELVCEADVDVLQSLLEKNLIRRWSSDRLGMLETIHEFARERLDALPDADAVRSRHAGYVADLVEAAEREYFGPAQGTWLDRLRAELPNIRAALAGPDGATAARIAAALPFFWFSQGQWGEARRWLADAAGRGIAEAPPDTRAKTLAGLALFTALEGEVESAVVLSDESVALARALGDDAILGQILIIRQMVLAEADRDDAFAEAARAAIELGRATGDRVVLAASLNNLAYLELCRGNHEPATALLDEGLDVVRGSGDAFNEAGVRINLASALLALGKVDEAAAGFDHGLRLASELGAPGLAVLAVEGLAAVSARRGDAEGAARLLGVADAHARAHDVVAVEPFEAERRTRTVAVLEAELGHERFSEALAEGGRLTLGDALPATGTSVLEGAGSATPDSPP